MAAILFSAVSFVIYRYAVFIQAQEEAGLRHELSVCHDWQKNIKNLSQICGAYHINSMHRAEGRQAFPEYSAREAKCREQVKSLRDKFSAYHKKSIKTVSYYEAAASQEEKGILPASEENSGASQKLLYLFLPDNRQQKRQIRRLLYECQQQNLLYDDGI